MSLIKKSQALNNLVSKVVNIIFACYKLFFSYLNKPHRIIMIVIWGHCYYQVYRQKFPTLVLFAITFTTTALLFADIHAQYMWSPEVFHHQDVVNEFVAGYIVNLLQDTQSTRQSPQKQTLLALQKTDEFGLKTTTRTAQLPAKVVTCIELVLDLLFSSSPSVTTSITCFGEENVLYF